MVGGAKEPGTMMIVGLGVDIVGGGKVSNVLWREERVVMLGWYIYW